jgi:bifunctional enzyme CysN/CysC
LANFSGTTVNKNAVAEIVLKSRQAMCFDSFINNPRLGRFVLVDGYDIVGGGVIAETEESAADAKASANIVAVGHKVTADDRAAANGHRGGVIWLTGLSGSGKSTIAMELERRLFLKGLQVTVLDGDNLRYGLCSDLGFTPEDRTENIRRAGEAAHLIAKAGLLVIGAFISPYRSDRDKVRAIAPDLFHEIHVSTPIEDCEARDPKGLYKKARAGEIAEFTGITAPYEPPVGAELVLETKDKSISQSVDELESYVYRAFGIDMVSDFAGEGI